MTDDERDLKAAADLKARGAKWMEKIRAAEKREEVWLRDAKIAEDIYLASDKAERKYDFNILHSNVETIVPAIFNSSPIPDVRERFRKGAEDEPARQASQAIERCIEVACDDGRLDVEIEGVAQDAFAVGRGILRVRMEQRFGVEALGFEVHPWNDFRFGPARRWEDVPWVAFRFRIPQEEVEKISDPELRRVLAKGREPTDPDADEDSDAELWECWVRDKKTVYFLADDAIVREEPDPLGLSGFFPMPMPAMPIRGTSTLTPVVPFRIYQRLADELDRNTRRIEGLTAACKSVGLIAGNKADLLANLEEAEDGTLIPIGDIEGVASTQGMNEAIAWWPVDKVIIVLRELYVARDQCKQAIYEITGISDIVRGQSAAQETATAQEIKTQWGSLRVKKLQRILERLVRDTFTICAEIICSKFQPATIQRMSGMQLGPELGEFLGQPLDHFRIDVESDSTVRADLTRMRAEMAEWLRGTGEYMSALVIPMAQSPQTMVLIPPAMKLYATFARTFSLGKQGEDAIEELIAATQQAVEQQQSQQGQPDPEQMKAQAVAQKAQADAEIKQMDLQVKQQEVGIRQQELQLEAQSGGLEAQESVAKIDLTKAQTEKVYAEIGKVQQEGQLARAEAAVDQRMADQDMALKARGQQQAEMESMRSASMQEREFQRSGEQQQVADKRADAESKAKVQSMNRKPNGNG